MLGWQDRIGSLEVGKLADIIAVPGDRVKDVTSLQHAKFVMKGAVVIKDEKYVAVLRRSAARAAC